ncbi:MAG: penicillin-binding protein 2 [Planctomycetes bacterium]|nr:penicillin-binding protein 2 [Planctomycetota bacterium]
MIRTGYFSKKRSRLLYCLILGFGGIIVRLVYLQLINSNHYDAIALKQHRITLKIECERGAIYDSKGRTLAESHLSKSLWSDPQKIKSTEELEAFVKQCSPIIGVAEDVLLKKCQQKNSFAWLKRKLSFDEVEKLAEYVDKTRGIYFSDEWSRFYPAKSMLSPVVGVVGTEHKGLTGLEARYEKLLKGETGLQEIVRDARRRVIYQKELIAPVKGNDVHLTIDLSIQTFLHQHLSKGFEEFKPKTASGIVMNALTGEILAMSTLPAHIPGNKIASGLVGLKPKMVLDVFEPGSTMKPLVYASLLEYGKGNPEEIVHCGHGAKRFGSRTLHDAHGYGELSLKDVIVKSSNIGAAIMGERLGNKLIHSIYQSLGFGQKCYLPLTGEPRGTFRPLKKWSKFSLTSLTMGHEISVTMPQMARAYCTLANGGFLLQPYLSNKVTDLNGEVIQSGGRVSLQKVFSYSSCRGTIDALEEVVKRGTAKRAKSTLYRIAGKTGTTEKLVDGKYVKDKNIGSFICLAPASNPKIVVMVLMDEPQGSSFGGVVAAPVARKVVEDTLQYMGVPYDEMLENEAI